MTKLKEEGGYTLIIALLLIVLFLSMSAVFVQASLSHAKQEQTVDHGNLAVVASEMGVEYYISTFKNHLDDAYNTTTNSSSNTLLAEYINCASTSNVVGCREQKHEAAVSSFITELNNKMAVEVNSAAVNIEREKSISNFKLQTTSVASLDVENKIKLDLTVLGKSGTTEKTLEADITFEIPEFFNVIQSNTTQEIENIFEIPGDLPICKYDINSKQAYPCKLGSADILTLINSIPASLRASVKIVVDDPKILCQADYTYTKVCQPKDLGGVTIYSKSQTPMKVSFENKFSTFNWYHKGTVEIDGPMNQSDTMLVFENLVSLSPFNDFHGTIVLMGNETIKATLEAGKKIKPGENGKMCLNLSGLSLDRLNQVKNNFEFNNGGKGFVYYYIDPSYAVNISNFTLHSDPSVIKITTAQEFLLSCGVQPIKPPDTYSFENFENPILDLEVVY